MPPFRVVPHAALAGNFAVSKKSAQPGRDLAGRLLGVVGERDTVGHVGDAVVAREPFEDLVARDQRVVERLEQVLVGVEPEVVADVDDVPRDLTGFNLGRDPRPY